MKRVFEDELSETWNEGMEIQSFTIPRVILGRSGRLLIQYCFSTGGEDRAVRERMLYGQMLAPGESFENKCSKGEVWPLPNLKLLVPVFPFDNKLKILRPLYSETVTADVLNDLIERLGSEDAKVVDLLSYRPERRSVFRVRTRSNHERKVSIAKLTTADKAKKMFQTLRSSEGAGFQSDAADGITVPHAVAWLPIGLVCVEEIDDPSLSDLLQSDRFIPACRATARTLFKIHACPLPICLHTILRRNWVY